MPGRKVYWYEGMFLKPHHFQAAERAITEDLRAAEDWNHPFNWGFRRIRLDREAISNFEGVVRSCEARFKDGTRISIPDDTEVETINLKSALTRSSETILYLAIPSLHRGRANVEPQPTGDGPRYWLESTEIEDDNTGSQLEMIEFRRVRAKLLVSGQDQTGYEVLPIAKVSRSAKSEATPQLDRAFVPPLLAIDGWPPLWQRVQALHYRVGGIIETLSARLIDRRISFESRVPGDAQSMLILSKINGVFSHLEAIGYIRGLTPLTIYAELCRTAGELAIFTAERRPPNMPPYNHEDLGACFRTVISYIDEALGNVPRDPFVRLEFIRAGTSERLELTVEDRWLTSNSSLYLAVRTDLSQDDCVKLMNRLDLKIGSASMVERYYQERLPGLKFEPVARLPQALPNADNLVYFHLDREGAAWRHVLESHSLGVRMNLNDGSFLDDRSISLPIKSLARTTHLQFALYVIS